MGLAAVGGHRGVRRGYCSLTTDFAWRTQAAKKADMKTGLEELESNFVPSTLRDHLGNSENTEHIPTGAGYLRG